MSTTWSTIAGCAALVAAQFPLRPPRAVRPIAAENARPFLSYDWEALITRFVSGSGIDYATFARVRRLMEVHLDRLSEARPDLFASGDERLAFYLNAYNAIAVYQVVLHYPVRSILEIPGAFTRPFPVGHENHSLTTLLHARIRPFGDPRVHAAIVPAAASAPPLRAYTPATLQQELDAQLRAFLADPRRGMRPMPNGKGVVLNPLFRAYAADFAGAGAIPGRARVLGGWISPQRVLGTLRAYAPASLEPLIALPDARVAFLTYDWSLNDTAASQPV
jgi:hypothetical protein